MHLQLQGETIAGRSDRPGSAPAPWGCAAAMIAPMSSVFKMTCCGFQLLEKGIATITHSVIKSEALITWESFRSYFESKALVCLQ